MSDEVEHVAGGGGRGGGSQERSLSHGTNDDITYTAPRQAMRCVKDTMRIVRGDTSATPTPFFARAERLGLLFTLNRKQALVFQRLENEQTSVDEVPELQKLVQFLSFVTSGVVAETQRVDEALLETKEEAIKIGREIKILDAKLQSLKRTPPSSLVERAIAEHFPSRIVIRQSQAKQATLRSAEIPDSLREQAEKLCAQINDYRLYLQNLGEKIRVLGCLQSQMHGTHRLKGNMCSAEIQTLVDEISLPSALRRATHLIRDLAHSGGGKAPPEELEGIPAIKILKEFLVFVEAGITTLLDDLFRADLRLKKAAAIQDITHETMRLHAEMERSRIEKQLAIQNVGSVLDATLFGPAAAIDAVSQAASTTRGASQTSQAGRSSVLGGTSGGLPPLPAAPASSTSKRDFSQVQAASQQHQHQQQHHHHSHAASPRNAGAGGDVELMKFFCDYCA